MVKDVVLSRPLRPELACVPSPQRRIAAEPLYAVDDVLEALAAQTLRVVTRKAMRDVQELSLDDEEFATGKTGLVLLVVSCHL